MDVKCIDCTLFRRDTVGDGHGIGTCLAYEPFRKTRRWEEAYTRLGGYPHYPMADRFCERFLANPLTLQWQPANRAQRTQKPLVWHRLPGILSAHLAI